MVVAGMLLGIKNEKKAERSKRETILHVQRVQWTKGFPTITKVSAIYLFIYLMFSFSSHFTSEETTYPEGTCINKGQMKTALVYYTQLTINSTEIRQIAQYLNH